MNNEPLDDLDVCLIDQIIESDLEIIKNETLDEICSLEMIPLNSFLKQTKQDMDIISFLPCIDIYF